MQTVILCGGTGTRLREETEFKPKPMVNIGGKPMLYHIMKRYAKYGHKEFVLALGYKSEIIKQYFYHFDLLNNDVEIETGRPLSEYHHYIGNECGWKVVLSDTGADTLKGGRLKKVERYVRGENFFCTYGDGIADINIDELLKFHCWHDKIATVTGIHPAPRFGEIQHEEGKVTSFSPKPHGKELINGGFFVFHKKIFGYLDEECELENVLESIASENQMMVYEHKGYWGCMDTTKEWWELQHLWDTGKAPW